MLQPLVLEGELVVFRVTIEGLGSMQDDSAVLAFSLEPWRLRFPCFRGSRREMYHAPIPKPDPESSSEFKFSSDHPLTAQ